MLKINPKNITGSHFSKLLIISFIALIIRLILATLPGFKIDVFDWYAWSLRLNELPFHQFYNDNYFSDYTPGYLYILAVLGYLKNHLNLTDSFFYYLLKIPAIFSEIMIGALAFDQLRKHFTIKIAFLGAGLIWFNLGLIFNSAIWGQIDAVLTLFMLISVYFLKQQKIILAALFLSLSLLIKPQAIILIPAFGLYLLDHRDVKTFLKLIVPCVLSIFLLSFPFFGWNSLTRLFFLIQKTAAGYPVNSLFAYNFWGIFGFWINDDALFGPLDYKSWSLVLCAIFFSLVSWAKYHQKLGLYSITALSCLAFYFLPTRVHERYLYPALVFLVFAFIEVRHKSLLLYQLVLSVLYFLSLYYVYVYYNEIYYKLPHLLYNQILFDFLQNYATQISLASTGLFVVTSWLIIKTKHDQKTL